MIACDGLEVAMRNHSWEGRSIISISTDTLCESLGHWAQYAEMFNVDLITTVRSLSFIRTDWLPMDKRQSRKYRSKLVVQLFEVICRSFRQTTYTNPRTKEQKNLPKRSTIINLTAPTEIWEGCFFFVCNLRRVLFLLFFENKIIPPAVS